MGFHVEINSILRSDDPYELVKGGLYDFRKTGSRIFFDDLPIWLTRSDWTALAEIQVVTQTRTPAEVIGKFRVSYIYPPAEQAAVTEVFRRLYAAEGDPNIYVLISGVDYEAAVAAGRYAPPSLATEHFIHASPFNQLNRVANKYYKELANVHLMVTALSKVGPVVKWEPATGGLYPHIYGELNMDAVLQAYPVAPNASGVFDLKREDFPA
ncbi:MAG TPA: DUF952 domain-containing protein [Chthoniobacteraceae bacterium]|jgi:uncharacterized protein (DUF952 family)|nr:DUF952 domain-containing protein [Chthoniobacteraceae bacterium]